MTLGLVGSGRESSLDLSLICHKSREVTFCFLEQAGESEHWEESGRVIGGPKHGEAGV